MAATDSIATLAAEIEAALGILPMPNNPETLYSPVRYALSQGGKRMRPALVLLGCKLYNDDTSQAIGPALAVELFHNFSLLHDDIMDNAPLRRGRPTVHAQWGANTAILSGDAMMVMAYRALERTDGRLLPAMLRIFNETALGICEGQQLDMDFELRDDVSIEEYEEMIRLKTAVLLAASLQLGAMAGGATGAQAEQMHRFGTFAGLAFQIQDDILDVFGDSGKVGKQRGGDIIANKKTYLLIKALELADGGLKHRLRQWIAAEDPHPEEKVREVTAIYEALGIRGLAEQRMAHFHALAMVALSKAGGRPHWENTLCAFTDALMRRDS